MPIGVGWAKSSGNTIMFAQRRAILPTRPRREADRVGNAPVRFASFFNAAAPARCPHYEIFNLAPAAFGVQEGLR